jgi:hypothetical protein
MLNKILILESWIFKYKNTFFKTLLHFFSLSPSMYVNVYRSVIYIYTHITRTHTYNIHTDGDPQKVVEQSEISKSGGNIIELPSSKHFSNLFYLSIDRSIYIYICIKIHTMHIHRYDWICSIHPCSLSLIHHLPTQFTMCWEGWLRFLRRETKLNASCKVKSISI